MSENNQKASLDDFRARLAKMKAEQEQRMREIERLDEGIAEDAGKPAASLIPGLEFDRVEKPFRISHDDEPREDDTRSPMEAIRDLAEKVEGLINGSDDETEAEPRPEPEPIEAKSAAIELESDEEVSMGPESGDDDSFFEDLDDAAPADEQADPASGDLDFLLSGETGIGSDGGSGDGADDDEETFTDDLDSPTDESDELAEGAVADGMFDDADLELFSSESDGAPESDAVEPDSDDIEELELFSDEPQADFPAESDEPASSASDDAFDDLDFFSPDDGVEEPSEDIAAPSETGEADDDFFSELDEAEPDEPAEDDAESDDVDFFSGSGESDDAEEGEAEPSGADGRFSGLFGGDDPDDEAVVPAARPEEEEDDFFGSADIQDDAVQGDDEAESDGEDSLMDFFSDDSPEDGSGLDGEGDTADAGDDGSFLDFFADDESGSVDEADDEAEPDTETVTESDEEPERGAEEEDGAFLDFFSDDGDDPEAESEAEVEVDAEPEPEADAEPEAEVESETEVEPEEEASPAESDDAAQAASDEDGSFLDLFADDGGDSEDDGGSEDAAETGTESDDDGSFLDFFADDGGEPEAEPGESAEPASGSEAGFDDEGSFLDFFADDEAESDSDDVAEAEPEPEQPESGAEPALGSDALADDSPAVPGDDGDVSAEPADDAADGEPSEEPAGDASEASVDAAVAAAPVAVSIAADDGGDEPDEAGSPVEPESDTAEVLEEPVDGSGDFSDLDGFSAGDAPSGDEPDEAEEPEAGPDEFDEMFREAGDGVSAVRESTVEEEPDEFELAFGDVEVSDSEVEELMEEWGKTPDDGEDESEMSGDGVEDDGADDGEPDNVSGAGTEDEDNADDDLDSELDEWLSSLDAGHGKIEKAPEKAPADAESDEFAEMFSDDAPADGEPASSEDSDEMSDDDFFGDPGEQDDEEPESGRMASFPAFDARHVAREASSLFSADDDDFFGSVPEGDGDGDADDMFEPIGDEPREEAAETLEGVSEPVPDVPDMEENDDFFGELDDIGFDDADEPSREDAALPDESDNGAVEESSGREAASVKPVYEMVDELDDVFVGDGQDSDGESDDELFGEFDDLEPREASASPVYEMVDELDDIEVGEKESPAVRGGSDEPESGDMQRDAQPDDEAGADEPESDDMPREEPAEEVAWDIHEDTSPEYEVEDVVEPVRDTREDDALAPVESPDSGEAERDSNDTADEDLGMFGDSAGRDFWEAPENEPEVEPGTEPEEDSGDHGDPGFDYLTEQLDPAAQEELGIDFGEPVHPFAGETEVFEWEDGGYVMETDSDVIPPELGEDAEDDTYPADGELAFHEAEGISGDDAAVSGLVVEDGEEFSPDVPEMFEMVDEASVEGRQSEPVVLAEPVSDSPEPVEFAEDADFAESPEPDTPGFDGEPAGESPEESRPQDGGAVTLAPSALAVEVPKPTQVMDFDDFVAAQESKLSQSRRFWEAAVPVQTGTEEDVSESEDSGSAPAPDWDPVSGADLGDGLVPEPADFIGAAPEPGDGASGFDDGPVPEDKTVMFVLGDDTEADAPEFESADSIEVESEPAYAPGPDVPEDAGGPEEPASGADGEELSSQDVETLFREVVVVQEEYGLRPAPDFHDQETGVLDLDLPEEVSVEDDIRDEAEQQASIIDFDEIAGRMASASAQAAATPFAETSGFTAQPAWEEQLEAEMRAEQPGFGFQEDYLPQEHAPQEGYGWEYASQAEVSAEPAYAQPEEPAFDPFGDGTQDPDDLSDVDGGVFQGGYGQQEVAPGISYAQQAGDVPEVSGFAAQPEMGTASMQPAGGDPQYEYVEVGELAQPVTSRLKEIVSEYYVFFIMLLLIAICIVIMQVGKLASTLFVALAFGAVAALMGIALFVSWKQKKQAEREYERGQAIYDAVHEARMSQMDAGQEQDGEDEGE